MRWSPLLAADAPPSTGAPGARGAAGQIIEWTYNPWRERPGAAAAAGVAALGLCLVATRMGLSPIVTLALCLGVVGALSPLLTPVRCRLDEEGVALHGPLGWTKRGWEQIRRGSLARGGLLVSPYAKRHWLDGTRGIFLPLPADSRISLLDRIQPRLVDHGL